MKSYETIRYSDGGMYVGETSDGVPHGYGKETFANGDVYEGDFVAPENRSTVITRLPMDYSEKRMLILTWDCPDKKGFNHYLCGHPPLCLEHYEALMKKHRLDVSQ